MFCCWLNCSGICAHRVRGGGGASILNAIPRVMMNRRYGRRAALVQQFSQNGDEDLRALCETIKFRWLRTAGERAQQLTLFCIWMVFCGEILFGRRVKGV